jgi:predicted nucleic acid-binding protein
MKVLDATFLIDYLNGVDATADYLLAREDERFILPVPAYAEALVGEGNKPDGDVAEAMAEEMVAATREKRRNDWLPG